MRVKMALPRSVEAALELSTLEVQRAYEEARRRVGIWSDVPGGYCAGRTCCATKFACLGCPRKVLDPTRRHQVERYRQWALQEMDLATREDLWPQAEVMRGTIQDCDVDLQRMDQIDAYLRDSARSAEIHVEGA